MAIISCDIRAKVVGITSGGNSILESIDTNENLPFNNIDLVVSAGVGLDPKKHTAESMIGKQVRIKGYTIYTAIGYSVTIEGES